MKLNEVKTETNFKGIFIPTAILECPDLKGDEKILLALIDHYTTNGEKYACYLTNEQMAELTGIDYYRLRDSIKPKLKEKGYITTNGGIKTVSKGCSGKHDTNGECSENHDTNGGCSGKHDGGIVKSTMGGVVESTIQRKNKKEEKELVNYLESDSHFTREETGNVSKLTEVPEWMDEVEPMEPFEQYSDMGDGYDNPLQADEEPTAPSVSKVSKEAFVVGTTDTLQADETLTATDNNNPPSNERETDPTTDNITSCKETETTPTQADLKLADLRHFHETGGTTTHTEGKSLSNGEKMVSTGVIETKGNVGEGKGEGWLDIQERKEQQAELNRKWENYLVQAPSMARDDRDRYFANFMAAVERYYTGDYIQRTKDRMTTEFNEATGASKPTHGLKEFTADTWRDTMVFLQNPKNTFGLTWERFNSDVSADYSLTDIWPQKLRYAFKRWVEEPMEPVVIGYGDNDLDDLPFSNPITKPVTLDVFIGRVETIKRDSMEKQAIKKERENDLPF